MLLPKSPVLFSKLVSFTSYLLLPRPAPYYFYDCVVPTVSLLSSLFVVFIVIFGELGIGSGSTSPVEVACFIDDLFIMEIVLRRAAAVSQ